MGGALVFCCVTGAEIGIAWGGAAVTDDATGITNASGVTKASGLRKAGMPSPTLWKYHLQSSDS
jgi:hypothetical protein